MPLLSAIFARVGLAGIAVILALGYYELYRVPAAYRSGHTAAALENNEARLREAAKRETERQAAQEKISRIEADYLNKTTDDAEKIAALEKAIAHAEQNSPGACADALPVELRDAINAIGHKAVTGNGPAISPPIVRPAGRSPQRSHVTRHDRPPLGKG